MLRTPAGAASLLGLGTLRWPFLQLLPGLQVGDSVPANYIVEEVDKENRDGVDAKGQESMEQRERVAKAHLPAAREGG